MGGMTVEPEPIEPIDAVWGGAGLVRAIAEELARLDVSGLGPGGLDELVAAARQAERAVDGLLLRSAQRAAELAAAGEGPGPEGVLSGGGDVSAAGVRAELARVEAADALPAFGAALASGTLGAGHLDTVARALSQTSGAERAALVGRTDGLLDAARRLSVDSFNRHVSRVMQQVREQLGTSREPVEPELRLWQGRDGVGRIAGRLTAEDFERVSSRVVAEMAAMCRESDGSAEVADEVAAPVAIDDRLAARALVRLVSGDGTSTVGRPSITLVVDAGTVLDGPLPAAVCETGSGLPVPAATAGRWACDAVVRKVVLDERRVPVDVGRRFRTATDAQWAALRSMYTGCAWFGCDRPLDWCQAHHVIHWTPPSDGPTDLANLVPLCHRHHHLAHEGGWRLVLDADRVLHLHQPDGTRWRTAHPDRLSTVGCPSPADKPGTSGRVQTECPPPADKGSAAA